MNTDFESKARNRVSNNSKLNAHENVIFYDWPNWNEHMKWVATAPVSEIEDWARSIEKDQDSAE